MRQYLVGSDMGRYDFVRTYINGRRILNIGVGDDPMRLGDRAVHMDIDPWRYPYFVQADAHHLPFKDDSFDCLIVSDVIEHLVDPMKALQEAKRVGYRLVITIFEEWRLGGAGQHIDKAQEVFPLPHDMYDFIKQGRLLGIVPEEKISHNPHINQFSDQDIAQMVKALDMNVIEFTKKPEATDPPSQNWHICLDRPKRATNAGITVIIPYFNCRYNENLKACLDSLQQQTRKPQQVIVVDDSLDDDRVEIKRICLERGVDTYLELPFVNGVPQWSKKFNTAYKHVTQEMILILCSNWVLEPKWLKEIAGILETLGKGNMVAGDSARADMGDQDGSRYDWFAGFPDLFLIPNPFHGIMPDFKRVEEVPGAKDYVYRMSQYWDYMDEGFLNLMWKDDWLPWDEDFDAVGAWHAVCEWGFRLSINGLRLWIKRGFKAGHGTRHPFPQWIDQNKESYELYVRKIEQSGRVKFG